MPKYLTAAAVAEMLSLSRSMVYKLCANGQLRTVKMGGAVRIEEASVVELLAACQVENKPARQDPPAPLPRPKRQRNPKKARLHLPPPSA